MGMVNTKLSEILNVERGLRHSIFPNCVIRILEYIEENEFEGEQNKIFDFFHCLLSSFWWQARMVEHIIYATKKDMEKSRSLVFLISNYAICVDKFFDPLINYLENAELQDAINSRLPMKNAGIVFGSFTDYRALTVAVRFVISLYGGEVKETTKSIFGEDAILGDINQDNERLEKWLNEVRERVLFILPPVKVWPRRKFWLDAESLSYKIGAEFGEIEKSFIPNYSPSYLNYHRVTVTTMNDKFFTLDEAANILKKAKGRKPVTAAAELALRENPDITGPKELLPLVNDILKDKGYDDTSYPYLKNKIWPKLKKNKTTQKK